FGARPEDALRTARASLRPGFDATARRYAQGWHAYLAGLKQPPRSADRRLYDMSVLVLAASEDKTHRGAFVASPTMPWVWGRSARPGPTTWSGRGTSTRSRPRSSRPATPAA